MFSSDILKWMVDARWFGCRSSRWSFARQRSKHSESEPIRIQVSDLLNFRINSHRPLSPLFRLPTTCLVVCIEITGFSWALSTTQTHHWYFSISDAVRTATPPTGMYSCFVCSTRNNKNHKFTWLPRRTRDFNAFGRSVAWSLGCFIQNK